MWPELADVPAKLVPRLEADAKYAVYVDRQAEDVARYRREEALLLPDDLDYGSLPGLSVEMRQKFSTVRPRSLGQAGRIEGVTPAALALIAAHARRAERPQRPPPLNDRARIDAAGGARLADDLDGPPRRLQPRPCFT